MATQSSTAQAALQASSRHHHHRASSVATSTSSRDAAPSDSASRPTVIVSRARRHRPRSTSSADLSLPPPPRYSQLSGALPVLQDGSNTSTGDHRRIASDAGAILPGAAAAAMRGQTTTAIRDEHEIPPLYGSVFPHRTRAERDLDRRAERRRSRRHSGSANLLGANLAESAAPSGSHSRRPRSRDRSATPPFEPRMHEYHLASSKGGTAPWATLRAFSQTSTSKPSGTDASVSQVMPRYTSGEPVTGSLDFNLDTPMSVNSIQLSLRGRIVTSSWEGGSQTFLDMPILSWTRNGGDPRPKSIMAHLEAAEARSSKKYDGKLSGKYSWPFSFPFPSKMEQDANSNSSSGPSFTLPSSRSPSPIPSQNSGDSKGSSSNSTPQFSLPQTFSERETKVGVQYEFVLRMTHGMLRSDSRLSVPVVYVPAVTPSPSSVLRQMAYAERMCVPGPEIDPAGWLQLAPAAVKGKLHGSERSTKLICNLSLANPQSYTRGTVLPVNMSIESSDVQALDVLAAPKTLVVRLMRRITYYEDGGGANPKSGPTVSVAQGRQKIIVVSTPAPDARHPTRRLVEETTEMDKAVWWVNIDVAEQEPNKRRLEGEIHLEKDMAASCDFPLFKISYTVELFPFESSSWVCSKSSTASSATTRTPEGAVPKPLISHPVVIATLHGEGHAAVPHTKPKKPSKKKPAKKQTQPGASSSTMPLVMSGFL